MLLLCDICPYNVMHILSNGMYFPCYMTYVSAMCGMSSATWRKSAMRRMPALCDVCFLLCHLCPCYVTYDPAMKRMSLLCDVCPYYVTYVPTMWRMSLLCDVCSLLCDVCSCNMTYVPAMGRLYLLCHYNVPAMWRVFLAMWRMFLQYDICTCYVTFAPAMLRIIMSLLCNVCFLLCDIIMCLPMWHLYLVWNQ